MRALRFARSQMSETGPRSAVFAGQWCGCCLLASAADPTLVGAHSGPDSHEVARVASRADGTVS